MRVGYQLVYVFQALLRPRQEDNVIGRLLLKIDGAVSIVTVAVVKDITFHAVNDIDMNRIVFIAGKLFGRLGGIREALYNTVVCNRNGWLPPIGCRLYQILHLVQSIHGRSFSYERAALLVFRLQRCLLSF